MADLDPIQTAHLVLQVIDTWLLDNQAGGFKSGKTISDNPRKGYGMSSQRYEKFCADISATLAKMTGRPLKLTKAWQAAHYSDAIEVFGSGVTLVLLDTPLTKKGAELREMAETFSF
jgi:hypothetical protein